ncbi:hypothetical protein HFP66_22220 [Bacillus sp. A17A.1]|nr:hypothetical protein [Bacillus thuringiensis]MED3358639.1 hypothetical protein [Bacillus thuringiensis]
MVSTWLRNNKVEFSVVKINDKTLLVCTNNIGPKKIIFIEDLQTGKKVFADKLVSEMAGLDIDKVVKELAGQL